MISLIISVVCKLKCPSNYNFLSIDFVFHNVYVCPIICHSLKRQFCAYHLRFQENLRMSQNILTLHLCGGRCQCKPKSDLSVSFEMLTGCGRAEHNGVNCCANFLCYLGARWQEESGAKLKNEHCRAEWKVARCCPIFLWGRVGQAINHQCIRAACQCAQNCESIQ